MPGSPWRLGLVAIWWATSFHPAAGQAPEVDAATIRGKVLCGYQGWFRTPGDASNQGYVHWSRDRNQVTPRSLTVEMWPDLAEFPPGEKHLVAGFTHPDGQPATLFSSDNPATVRRHFGWMLDHGIDGVWLQQFVSELPGGPGQARAASRLRVLDHVARAAEATGRAWAVTFDLSGMPPARALEVMSTEWLRMVASGITRSPRYLHQGGRPVVEVFGYYHGGTNDLMSVELAERITAFFHEAGAFLVGSGDWNWRKNPDPAWQAALARLDAIKPWNVGNYRVDALKVRHASTATWPEDQRLCESRGQLWLPVVYPGFGWDNLKHLPPGQSTIPRSGGRFYWDQFVELARLKADAAFVAMFDEVDEGTAIFKVTNQPPSQARFLTYDGLPGDWYLRLTGEGSRMLRGERPPSAAIPIQPDRPGPP